jgi:hypothetical protein
MRLTSAVVLAGFACFTLAGCGKSRSTAAIERVLQADKGTTTEVRSATEVVRRMEAIDMTDCPNDFKAAYLAHIYAWKSVATVEWKAVALKNEAESTGTMVEAFVRGFFLDPFGKSNELRAEFRHLQAEYDAAHNEVKQTFLKVEQIAIGHGADLPKK